MNGIYFLVLYVEMDISLLILAMLIFKHLEKCIKYRAQVKNHLFYYIEKIVNILLYFLNSFTYPQVFKI